MKDLPTLRIIEELGRLRPEDKAKLEELNDDEHPQLMHWCAVYLTAIRPNRIGDILNQPRYLFDIAQIGDEVWAEMELELYKS